MPGTNSLETQAIATSIIWIQFSLLQDSIYVKSGSFNQLWALCKVISIGATVSRCSSKKVLLNFANFTVKHLCWSLFHCHFLPPERQRFSDIFRGYKKRPVAWNGLKWSRKQVPPRKFSIYFRASTFQNNSAWLGGIFRTMSNIYSPAS